MTASTLGLSTDTHSGALVRRVESLTSSMSGHQFDDADSAGLIDLIRALEELKCAAEGAQTAAAHTFDAVCRAQAAARGIPETRQGRGVAHQVALARHCSPARAQRLLGMARVLPDELPHTYAALRAGKVSEWRAFSMARETIHSELADRRRVDETLAGDAAAFDAMSDREASGKARALADQLDPEAACRRRRYAEADRHVSLRPAPDTMTWLTALLPVKDGVACKVALDRAADAARAVGDERSRGQVQADALTQAVTQGAVPRTGDPWTTDPSDSSETPEPPPSTPVALELVISDAALLGANDDSAWLGGYGDIPAELAREMVKAASADGKAELRRLYVDQSGSLVAMDSRSRTFPEGLATMIRLRDQVCRTPWCDAPIRHLDHVQPHIEGGKTTYDNGQGLCEACNYAKQANGWVSTLREGLLEVRTPTGHRHRSRAPDLPRPATLHSTLDVWWSRAS